LQTAITSMSFLLIVKSCRGSVINRHIRRFSPITPLLRKASQEFPKHIISNLSTGAFTVYLHTAPSLSGSMSGTTTKQPSNPSNPSNKRNQAHFMKTSGISP
jgi:hypothetical protein